MVQSNGVVVQVVNVSKYLLLPELTCVMFPSHVTWHFLSIFLTWGSWTPRGPKINLPCQNMKWFCYFVLLFLHFFLETFNFLTAWLQSSKLHTKAITCVVSYVKDECTVTVTSFVSAKCCMFRVHVHEYLNSNGKRYRPLHCDNQSLAFVPVYLSLND